MTIDEFVEIMKNKVTKELLEVSSTGSLSKRAWDFPNGQAEIIGIRGGAIEKASIMYMTLQGFTMPGVTGGALDSVVFQMEVFPDNPYCPMGHFNTQWMISEPRRYFMNLDLFPAVRVEEDLRVMRFAMDEVADRFGKDRDKMRERLDEHYTMEYFAVPLATKVGCKLLELKDEELDLFITAYDTFFNAYLDIISKRKGIAYTENDMQLKLERNGKWLEYLSLKDRAIKAARDQGIPPDVLIEMGFPPSVIF
jgi:coproporphyrinogen III oxidase